VGPGESEKGIKRGPAQRLRKKKREREVFYSRRSHQGMLGAVIRWQPAKLGSVDKSGGVKMAVHQTRRLTKGGGAKFEGPFRVRWG